MNEEVIGGLIFVVGGVVIVYLVIRLVSGIITLLTKGITFAAGHAGGKHAAGREKQTSERKMRELADRYAAGALLREVLTHISAGGQLPHEIRIYHDRIEGIRAGTATVYDFAEHRVHNLEQVAAYNQKDEALLLKPQMAMAEAINRLMGGKYEVFDKGDREVRIISPTCTNATYRSNFVMMKLKSTMPNRSF